jgi:hypothetical protein
LLISAWTEWEGKKKLARLVDRTISNDHGTLWACLVPKMRTKCGREQLCVTDLQINIYGERLALAAAGRDAKSVNKWIL